MNGNTDGATKERAIGGEVGFTSINNSNVVSFLESENKEDLPVRILLKDGGTEESTLGEKCKADLVEVWNNGEWGNVANIHADGVKWRDERDDSEPYTIEHLTDLFTGDR